MPRTPKLTTPGPRRDGGTGRGFAVSHGRRHGASERTLLAQLIGTGDHLVAGGAGDDLPQPAAVDVYAGGRVGGPSATLGRIRSTV